MTDNSPETLDATPTIERVRHEIKRRTLTVTDSRRITPNMLRITLSGDDLADFNSAAPDDHVKIFTPVPGGEDARRDYTPRMFDTEKRELVIDFALHDAGPATAWALGAKPGDTLTIGGPRGSRVIRGVSRWLLIGDETALPAIGRRIEEAEAGTPITSLVAIAGPQDEQQFETQADLTTLWVHRPVESASEPARLLEALSAMEIDPQTFVWVAAEASVVRAIRAHLFDERGHDRQRVKASGYWVSGRADTTENFD